MLAIEHGRSESWIICKLEKQEQKNFVIGIKRKDWPCFTSLLGIETKEGSYFTRKMETVFFIFLILQLVIIMGSIPLLMDSI